jgi:DNA-directed RNA polymerase subunit alpha
MSTEKASVRELLLSGEALSAETVNEIRQRVQGDPTAYEEVRDLVRELAEPAEPARKSRADGKVAYAQGMACWLLGRYEEAAKALEPVEGRVEVKYYFGSALAEAGRWEQSAKVLESVPKKSEWYLDAQVLLAEVNAKLGKTDEAQALLEALPAETHESADYWATRGLAAELGGEVAVARELYHRALELDPNHPRSLFRLAYSLDLSGSDEQAVELYERCVNLERTHVNALINLGVLYEDSGEARKAIQCYERVLAAVPTHERARLYLKDVQATLSEVVDEVELKRRDQLERVLGTPITDFELSVRSQKCLEQMNIHTLGDLTRVTEVDLLARKNFGETSLAEIKVVMSQKGLRLGQALEESEVARATASTTRSRKEAELASKLASPLTELELSVRSRRCMEELKLKTVGELTQRTEEDLLACRNFGQVSLAEVKEKLTELGLRLKSGA